MVNTPYCCFLCMQYTVREAAKKANLWDSAPYMDSISPAEMNIFYESVHDRLLYTYMRTPVTIDKIIFSSSGIVLVVQEAVYMIRMCCILSNRKLTHICICTVQVYAACPMLRGNNKELRLRLSQALMNRRAHLRHKNLLRLPSKKR